MAKRLKLRISRVFLSFQSCRSKDPSDLPENPQPVIFRLSTVIPKTIGIDVPASTAFPNPFPPTQSSSKYHHSSLRRHVSGALVSVGCGCRSRTATSCRYYVDSSDDNIRSPDYKWKRDGKWHVVARVHEEAPRRKIYSSSLSGDSDDETSPKSVQPLTKMEKKKPKKKQMSKKSKLRLRSRISTSSDSGWFSSGREENDDEENGTLVSTSRSLSTDSSSEFYPNLDARREPPSVMNGQRRHKKKNNMRREKHNALRCNGGTAPRKATRTGCPSPDTESPARLSVFRRMIPCVMEGKVRESYAVVKKSKDPYEDFKRSMLEMILEKQMFEAKDLEQLLQCFLSLNSRQHHGVIVEAFSEIWESLFCRVG
uniref:Transcription repressor n=1 Tax=Nelumbo nucifera TaxID=4432 RepID=A0A822Z6J5_NELNU|nr:TPA_asm: hypothetical protein HUJ06_015005 [Nelumbo nucifera]